MSGTCQKTPLLLNEQVQLLIDRGMVIDDRTLAENVLCKTNYYRFAGYALPFREVDAHNTVKESFRAGTRFDDVYRIITFDSALRRLLSKYLEPIEISFRTAFCYEASTRTGDSFWFENAGLFNNQPRHTAFLSMCDEAIKLSQREPMIKHYTNDYQLPRPPGWVMIEIVSWGEWSKAYKNFKLDKIRNAVAGRFGCQAREFSSWMVTLRGLRNHCAHHARIWNRQFTDVPVLSSQMLVTTANDRRLHPLILVMEKLLRKLDLDTDFRQEYEELLAQYPDIDRSRMGERTTP